MVFAVNQDFQCQEICFGHIYGMGAADDGVIYADVTESILRCEVKGKGFHVFRKHQFIEGVVCLG